MKVLLFDNYDSFTYNLLHILNELGATVEVRRNDQIRLEEVRQYDKILLSPGPGIPEEAGILLPLIKEYAPTKSILGVCLGEQAIGQAFGARLINLKEVYHGIASPSNRSRPTLCRHGRNLYRRTLPFMGSRSGRFSILSRSNRPRYRRQANHGTQT